MGRSDSVIHVDAETHRRIEAFARADDTTPGEVVRRAVESYRVAGGPTPASEPESVLDVLRRAGLIDCVESPDGSPTDLATNPAHMEGFGRG